MPIVPPPMKVPPVGTDPVFEFGVNLTRNAYYDAEIKFGDLVCRGHEWIQCDYNGGEPSPTKYRAPMIPWGQIGEDWPDMGSNLFLGEYNCAGILFYSGAMTRGPDGKWRKPVAPYYHAEGEYKDYELEWKGGGSCVPRVIVSGAEDVIVTPHAGANRVTYRINWGPNPCDAEVGQALKLVVPRLGWDPADPVREVHFWMPGCARIRAGAPYDVTGGVTWYPPFVESLRRVNGGWGPHVIRFLNLNAVHFLGMKQNIRRQGSTILRLGSATRHMTLASFPRPWHSHWGHEQWNWPMPYEFIADLCDQLWSMAHVCVPYQPLYNAGSALSADAVQVMFSGSGYEDGWNIAVSDLSGKGSGATATYATNAQGGIQSVTITGGGSGYANEDAVRVIITPPAGWTGEIVDFVYTVIVKGTYGSSSAPIPPDQDNPHLSDADYQAYVEEIASTIKNGHANLSPDGTPSKWNYGQDFAGMNAANKALFELSNECWNSGYQGYRMLRTVISGGAYDGTWGLCVNNGYETREGSYGSEACRAFSWIKAEFGEEDDEVGQACFFVGGHVQGEDCADWLGVQAQPQPAGAFGAIATDNPDLRIDAAGSAAYLPHVPIDAQIWDTEYWSGLMPFSGQIGPGNYEDPTPSTYTGGEGFVTQVPAPHVWNWYYKVSGTTVARGTFYCDAAGNVDWIRVAQPGRYVPQDGSFDFESDPNAGTGDDLIVGVIVPPVVTPSWGAGTAGAHVCDLTALYGSIAIRGATMVTRLGLNNTAIAAWENVTELDAPEHYLYEGGYGPVPGTASSWAWQAVYGARDADLYDLYVAPTTGYLAAIMGAGVTSVAWLSWCEGLEAAADGAGSGPFGHAEWMLQPTDGSLTWPVPDSPPDEGCPKLQMICRDRFSAERVLPT